MEIFDEIYKTELNFVEEFNLSRVGMLKLQLSNHWEQIR